MRKRVIVVILSCCGFVDLSTVVLQGSGSSLSSIESAVVLDILSTLNVSYFLFTLIFPEYPMSNPGRSLFTMGNALLQAREIMLNHVSIQFSLLWNLYI